MRKKFEITEKELTRFTGYLRREEREDSTIESYLRAARQFAAWLDGRVVTKELAAAWKAQLLEQGYRPVSVNAMLAAVNKLLVCMGREDCKVRYLKLQRQIFLTKKGTGLSRRFIWAEMKKLCEAAKVARSKVFPYNLRGLFARTFYAACRGVVHLADVLGHSSIETTRIYLLSTAKESARQLDGLGLLSG